jgi:exodeoxyribonuclease-3
VLKVATWNVNSIKVRLPQVLEWLRTETPDILALQETKISDDRFPHAEFSQAGYHSICNGQKTYNGVALLSRAAARDSMRDLPDFQDPQKRVLYAGYGSYSVLNLYVPNGMAVGTEKYAYKLDWLEHLQEFVRQCLDRTRLLLVLGDFNIAPTDADVHDPAAWRGQVLVSEPEREHFFRLVGTGLVDCYRLFERQERGYTWWDYRASSFARDRGLRIDHILASTALAACCRSCDVDKAPRRLQRPSDHAPLAATFAI